MYSLKIKNSMVKNKSKHSLDPVKMLFVHLAKTKSTQWYRFTKTRIFWIFKYKTAKKRNYYRRNITKYLVRKWLRGEKQLNAVKGLKIVNNTNQINKNNHNAHRHVISGQKKLFKTSVTWKVVEQMSAHSLQSTKTRLNIELM